MHTYELTGPDQREHRAILDRIETDGGLFGTDATGALLLDGAGSPAPLDYVILRSRKWLVDARGVLWRLFAEGTPKHADGRGAPWRNSRIEMWTGRWRKVAGPDGQTTYAKQLVARPIDKRINGHPGMSNIDWYLNVKGYKHPFDGPDTPPDSSVPDAPNPTAPAVASKPTHRPAKPARRTNQRGPQ